MSKKCVFLTNNIAFFTLPLVLFSQTQPFSSLTELCLLAAFILLFFFDSYLSSCCNLSSFRLLSTILSVAIYHPSGCYLPSFRLLSTILPVAIYHPSGCYLPSFRLLSTILSVAIYHPFGCYLSSFRLLSTILSVAIYLFLSFRAFSPRFRPAVSSPHVRLHR